MSQIPSVGRTVHSQSRLVEYRDRVVEAAEREQTEVHVEKSNRVGRDAQRH